MSVMIGGVTERLAPDSDFIIWDNVTNSSIVNLGARDAERIKVAAAVTFLSGLFQVKKKVGSRSQIYFTYFTYLFILIVCTLLNKTLYMLMELFRTCLYKSTKAFKLYRINFKMLLI